MRIIKYTLATILAVILVSCDAIVGDPDLPIPLDETLNEDALGGFVRVLETNSAAFDLADIPNANWSITAEVADNENGNLSESVIFYATYVDVDRNALPETGPIKTFQVSDLQASEDSGLPSGTFTLMLTEVLDAYGSELTSDDLNIGDRFDIRWELHMKDGRVFSSGDVSQSVTGGFYRSPFAARAGVVAAVPEDMFVGDYTFEQLDPAPAVAWASQFTGPDNSDGWIWESQSSPGSFTATLSVDSENELVGRVFTATYFEEWGFGPTTNAIELILDKSASMARETDVGLGCGANLTIGKSEDNLGQFDINDDSQFTLVVMDNFRGDCGQPRTEVRFNVTKN